MRARYFTATGKHPGKPFIRRIKPAYLIGGLLVVLLAVQFAVPPDYIMPRAYIGAHRVGLQQRDTLRDRLTAESQKIEISFDSKIEEFSAREVGLSTDVDATIAQLPTIKSSDRLIPFMPLYKAIKKNTVQPVVHRDKDAIRQFALKASQRLTKEPLDATARVQDGRLIIVKDQKGTVYAAAKIERALLAGDPFSNDGFEIISDKLAAKTQAKDLQPLRSEFDEKASQTLKVRYSDTVKTIGPDTLKKWLTVAEDSSSGEWSLKLDSQAFDDQIEAWSKEYNIAPGITQVAYYDDVETSRKVGPSGRALDKEVIKKQLNEWIAKPVSEPVTLASVTLAPEIVATRTYSYSSAQLQARLDKWIAGHSGHYQVAVRELNGRGREASYNVAQQTVMASTYKPFLAFVAYRQAETGALNLNTPLLNGKNIEQCIEVMIIYSDNDCAVKLGRYIGWEKVDQVIAAAGFKNVSLNNYDKNGNLDGDKLVNAREQARFLAQLSGGSLINRNHTDTLMGYMKRQVYREGIPAGSRGAVVADKVGFLDSYLHDVGIVYGPKSTYALVIMSEGSSWSNIKDLAQAVYDFMNE